MGPLAGCTLYSYPDPNTPRYGIDFDPTTDTLYIVGRMFSPHHLFFFSLCLFFLVCSSLPFFSLLKLSVEDTQQFSVNPATGACTKGTNLFFNGRGRGSTPTRAVAFTNNILPSSSTNEYILTGVCLERRTKGEREREREREKRDREEGDAGSDWRGNRGRRNE